MNNGIYVIMELKLQNHFLHVTSKQQGICVKKNVSKNEKHNVKHHAPSPLCGRCPRGVCGRRVRGIGLSTLNSQVSTKNHNNIVTNIPPGLRLKFIANTQNYWGIEKANKYFA